MRGLNIQISMKIINRKEAKQQGLPHYFTGKPCKNGHISKRVVVNCTCLKCAATYRSNNKKTNPERVAFVDQRSKAKMRNIEWNFTFQEWLDFWEHKIEFRNGEQTGLVMGRFYDCGPYEPENCYITTCEDNFKEFNTGQYLYRPHTLEI